MERSGREGMWEGRMEGDEGGGWEGERQNCCTKQEALLLQVCCADSGLGAPLASPPLPPSPPLPGPPPMRFGLNWSWLFLCLFPHPFVLKNLRGFHEKMSTGVSANAMSEEFSGDYPSVRLYPLLVRRFLPTKTLQHITSPFAPADHRTDALMAAISFHFIRDDIIPNSYTTVIVS